MHERVAEGGVCIENNPKSLYRWPHISLPSPVIIEKGLPHDVADGEP